MAIETRQRTEILARDEEGNVLNAEIARLRTMTAADRRIAKGCEEARRAFLASRATLIAADPFAIFGDAEVSR